MCDDAPGFRLLLSAFLAEAGVDVVAEGRSWADAERLAHKAEVVVCDLWMPEFDGRALARVRRAAANATLAIVTALDPDHAQRLVDGHGVDLVLPKSLPPADLAGRIASYAA